MHLLNPYPCIPPNPAPYTALAIPLPNPLLHTGFAPSPKLLPSPQSLPLQVPWLGSYRRVHGVTRGAAVPLLAKNRFNHILLTI